MERYLSNRSKFSAVAYELPAKQGLQHCSGRACTESYLKLHTNFQQNKDCNFGSGEDASHSNPSCIRTSSKTRTATIVCLLPYQYIQKLHTNFQQNKDCNTNIMTTAIRMATRCIRTSSKTRTATSHKRTLLHPTRRVAYELPAKQGLQQFIKRITLGILCSCIRPSSKTRTATPQPVL